MRLMRRVGGFLRCSEGFRRHHVMFRLRNLRPVVLFSYVLPRRALTA